MSAPAYAPIVGILADNLRLRGSVMPLGRGRLTAWARGLGLPRGGEQVIYTGHMYQIIPPLATMEWIMQKLEGTPLARLFGLGRWANRFVNLSFFMSWSPAATRRRYDARLRRIAGLLRGAGESFGYLYGRELYTGALIYDLGMDEAFRRHARKVWARLQAAGVKRVITVDPHTTEMLREVYPRFVPGFHLEVRNYLEVLAEKGGAASAAAAEAPVLHDSCVYARTLNVVKPPRDLLIRAGRPAAEPEAARKFTHCCGGPIESLFPTRAGELARERLAQLLAAGRPVAAAMCPICLHGLEQAARGQAIEVRDLAELI